MVLCGDLSVLISADSEAKLCSKNAIRVCLVSMSFYEGLGLTCSNCFSFQDHVLEQVHHKKGTSNPDSY